MFFSEYNPLSQCLYFLATTGIAMFCMEPVILFLSLLGAIIFYISQSNCENTKTHLFSLLLFIFMAVINPIVSHNGVTVLFVMNDNPVTLEAVIYGVAASLMIISVLYWFRSFSLIMTSDRLLYLFSALSPKIALVLSMSLRYVPLFKAQIKKINNSQKALGLYKDDNIIDRFKGSIRVFSVLVTWCLENGIITADSMAARGYGVSKRSHFKRFTFKFCDIILIFLTVLFFSLTVICLLETKTVYYPEFKIPELSFQRLTGYISYAALVFMPSIIQAKEVMKWKYLMSKI